MMVRYYVIDCFGNVWGDTDNREHAEGIIKNNMHKAVQDGYKEGEEWFMAYYEPEIIEEGR